MTVAAGTAGQLCKWNSGLVQQCIETLWQPQYTHATSHRGLLLRFCTRSLASLHRCCVRLILTVVSVLLYDWQVMQLWEVLWAQAWKQHRLKRLTAAEAQQADSPGVVTALDSPRSDSSNVTAKSQRAAPEAGPIELFADSSSSSRCGNRVQQVRGAGLFTCFVAAVIMSQRRQILDHCYDADDVLRLFHGLKHVDVWQCLQKAQEVQQAASC